ncbi:hypothetical protein QVD17_19567 [Tagetes erecta]|uniref:Uncharacterized protein n=1 Tax=Tagetes erecta TaxID=13708 RepID=A0AAD8NXF6_TARER|nr:hypothetical protein QVD17_19567 [Tagetes erecta]
MNEHREKEAINTSSAIEKRRKENEFTSKPKSMDSMWKNQEDASNQLDNQIDGYLSDIWRDIFPSNQLVGWKTFTHYT